MQQSAFGWYELRTLDPQAAARFYCAVLELQQRDEPDRRLLLAGTKPAAAVAEITVLPERARARGAPPHWLGHLSVPDVDAAALRLLALGGQALGPALPRRSGAKVAVLKDPFGAVLALTSQVASRAPALVAWHEHYSPDHARAGALYADLFGWQLTDTVQVPRFGAYQRFAFGEAGPDVGGMTSTAQAPQVHPQWCLHFCVTDLDAALARLRAAGGATIGEPLQLASGARVAPCEDAQGAAFALREPHFTT